MSEPVIHVRRVKDPDAHGVFVEQDDANPQHFVVTSRQRLEWLETLEAVTSFIELRERSGRDD